MTRQPATTPRAAQGKIHTVNLASGGTLTLALSIDPFVLCEADRRFIFELVDKVTGYGKRNGRKADIPADTPDCAPSQAEPASPYGG